MNKNVVIGILAVLFVIAMVVSVIFGNLYYNNNQSLKLSQAEVANLKDQVSQLNADYTKLVADNVKYMKESRLKSFTTLKELERFVKADTTDQEFKSDYASSACLNMMVNAREQGYWLGMGVLNQTQENLFSAMLNDRKYGGISWTTYCLAVVGDGELFYVDPQNDSYVFPVMTMSADFADYSGRAVNFQ